MNKITELTEAEISLVSGGEKKTNFGIAAVGDSNYLISGGYSSRKEANDAAKDIRNDGFFGVEYDSVKVIQA